MAHVIFYAKPGCKGNARQMQVLRSAGHEVEVRDLLAEAWTKPALLSFFGDRPAAEWLNRSAERVKSGEIIPERLSPAQAMALLLADPALIRRPLIEVAGERSAGWEAERLEAWIGLGSAMSPGKEGCAGGGARRQSPAAKPRAGSSACPLSAGDS